MKVYVSFSYINDEGCHLGDCIIENIFTPKSKADMDMLKGLVRREVSLDTTQVLVFNLIYPLPNP